MGFVEQFVNGAPPGISKDVLNEPFNLNSTSVSGTTLTCVMGPGRVDFGTAGLYAIASGATVNATTTVAASTTYYLYVTPSGFQFSTTPPASQPLLNAVCLWQIATGNPVTTPPTTSDLRGILPVAPQLPAGVTVPFAGSAAPTGWLLCDGSAVSRTTFAALFASIGTTYGVGDGSTTFNVPDLRGRTPVGVGSVGTNGQPTVALAATGGEQTHALTVAELASHSHSHNHGSHTHGVATNTVIQEAAGIGLTNVNVSNQAQGDTSKSTAAATPSTDATTAGSGTAHNNMQPYIGLTYIIKT